jgi:dienelactone hydrolase
MLVPEPGEGLDDTYDIVGSAEPEEGADVSEMSRDPTAEDMAAGAEVMPKRQGRPKKARPKPPSRWNIRLIITSAVVATILTGAGVVAYQSWPTSHIWLPSKTDDSQISIRLPRFRDPGPGVEIEPGVIFHQVVLPGGTTQGLSNRLWLYLPRDEHGAGPFPCVLMAAEGHHVADSTLDDDDRAQHVPFVKAGFAVLAYEVEGAAQQRSLRGPGSRKADLETFLGGYAGLLNAKVAVAYVLAKVPQVDPTRIYAVGFGTAGTTAMLLAEHEPRIRGCALIAAPIDLERWLGPTRSQDVQNAGGSDLLTRFSPRTNEAKLTCPLFLFYSRGDTIVPVTQARECEERLGALGRSVTVEVVPTGGHGEALLRQAIPRVVEWLQKASSARS